MPVPLIGRDADLAALDGLVDSSRLVTVVGPGGVGKTRLVDEWVRRHGSRFGGGVRMVSLAGEGGEVGEAADGGVVDRVAARLGFGSSEAPLLAASTAPTVVVLDNCESAFTAARTIAAALTQAGSAARVVATSREPLRLPAAHVQVVEPLPVPLTGSVALEESPAVELFVRLARVEGASWTLGGAGLDEATLGDIAELVRRLDGLPLAIELAAARTRALTPGELLVLLDRRLDLLARPAGAAPGRHRSLRAAIDTSYGLLSPQQQVLLRRMAVFPAPFDHELVQRVAALDLDVVDVVDQVGELVDRSLVVGEQSGGRTQYRLYDSIRAYAQERLRESGEADTLQERYVDELASIADELVADARERWSPGLVAAIVGRFSHLLTAVEWSLADDTPARAYRLVVPLYGPIHGPHAAAVAALARRVALRWDGYGTALHAEVLAVGASAMLFSGDLEAAFAYGHQAAGDPKGVTAGPGPGPPHPGLRLHPQGRPPDRTGPPRRRDRLRLRLRRLPAGAAGVLGGDGRRSGSRA